MITVIQYKKSKGRKRGKMEKREGGSDMVIEGRHRFKKRCGLLIKIIKNPDKLFGILFVFLATFGGMVAIYTGFEALLFPNSEPAYCHSDEIMPYWCYAIAFFMGGVGLILLSLVFGFIFFSNS